MDKSDKFTPATSTSISKFDVIETTTISKLKLIQILTTTTSNPRK